MTVDEIHAACLAWLEENGQEPIGRSSVGRYLARVDQVARRVQTTRQAAEVLAARWGAGGDRQVVRAAIEALQAAVLDMALDADTPLDAETVARMSRALRELTSAERAAADTIERERAVAADAAAGEARRQGLSPEAAEAIRAAVQGSAP